MATKKKKKNVSIPDVPESQQVDVASLLKPMTADQIMDLWSRMQVESQKWTTAERRSQVELQEDLFRSMSALQREQGPQFAATAYNMMQQYAPMFDVAYGELGNNLRNILALGPSAQFNAAYTGLGRRVMEGLNQGYELGPDLAGEIEQGIRAAQTARGNYLGPALSAEEAYGKGSAAVNLYNQRLGAAQNFLQGRNPRDIQTQIAGQMQNFIQGRNPADVMGQMAGTFMGQNYYPAYQGLNNQGVAAANVLQSGLQPYNANVIGAYNANNQAQYNNYDRNFEQFLYNQAVQHGLYSMPSAGGGGMGGQIGGAAIGAVGAIGGGLLAF